MMESPVKLARWFGLLFLVMVIATAVLAMTQPSKGMVKTTAVITDVEEIYDTDVDGMATTEYQYYVDYTADGQTYKHRALDYSAPDFDVGKEVEVHYDPADPAVISSDTSSFMTYTAIVAGVSLLLCGFFFLKARKQG